MQKRADITVIRVISMLMIVLCHTVTKYTIIPGNQIISQFLNVGVEIFFAMSGFLYANKNIDSYKSWIIARTKRIYIPILIVVAADIAVLAFFFATRYDAVTYITYLLNMQGLLFINWNLFGKFISEISNLGPLWFTTIIMLCYALVPLFQKVRDCVKSKQKTKIYLIIILSFFLVCFVLESTTGFALFYIPVFWTGYMLGDIDCGKKDFSIKKIIAYIITISLMVALRIVLKFSVSSPLLYLASATMTNSVLGIFIMLFMIELGKNFPNFFEKIGNSKAVIFLDNISFYIYLVHGIFCMGVTDVYARFDLLPATLIFIAATFISAEILSVITNAINSKLLSKIK